MEDKKKQIILYGLEGADKQYRAACYYCIYEQDISVKNIKFQAKMLRAKYPGVKVVYMIDNEYGLKRSYIESYKAQSIEGCAIFKDLLERYGEPITT